jgi:hypothetical protein
VIPFQVATPLKKYFKYTTRSTSQGVTYSFPELEKVYRRRLNRLAPRRLLDSLGEEALIDIQYLLQTNNKPTVNNPTNNPNATISTFLSPLNFAVIQGAPHDVPEKAIDKFPIFLGNNAISANSHISSFHKCVEKYCRGHNKEDVKTNLFVFSLEGDVAEWFTYFSANKFNTLNSILDEFKKRWGDQKEHRFQLVALTTSHKKENETVVEFNTKFNSVVKSLHNDVKPSDLAILIYYIEAFEGEMRYALRDKDPQTLEAVQATTIRIEQNMLEARKSNILGFTKGSSSQPYEEKKKNVENQKSSNDGMKELTQLIKQMEINHANQLKQMEINQTNQITALQNRLIAVERGQASRVPHRPNDKWPKKFPPQDQRPPNPFESTNLVDHQAIHYCRPCEQFHDESTCQVFLQLYDETRPYGYLNKQVNMFGHDFNVDMYDWMDSDEPYRGVEDMNCMGDVVLDKTTELFGPKPTPQQIVEMAKFKGINYQRNGKKSQEKNQITIPMVASNPLSQMCMQI